jgi:hypothetical protein
MMQAARTSETMVNFYQTTWRYNPEDSHLHTHHRENLKSYTNLLDVIKRNMKKTWCMNTFFTHCTWEQGITCKMKTQQRKCRMTQIFGYLESTIPLQHKKSLKISQFFWYFHSKLPFYVKTIGKY